MKAILLGISIFITGCASTTVSENGKQVFRTQANASRLVYRSPAGSYLEVEGLNHSIPTRAGISGVSAAGTAITGVAGALITNGLAR